jgi:hypothetical protein
MPPSRILRRDIAVKTWETVENERAQIQNSGPRGSEFDEINGGLQFFVGYHIPRTHQE